MKTFIAAFLLSGSAFAADFTCVATMAGKEIARATETVAEVGETVINLGTYKDIELVGSALHGQVSVFMISENIRYGTISMNAASYRMLLLGEGQLELTCSLE